MSEISSPTGKASPFLATTPVRPPTRKRGREGIEDFGELSEVGHASPSARVHAIVEEVSDMKKGQSNHPYFDGTLTDGKTSMRFFGYDQAARRKLVEANESKKPIALNNCEVKNSTRGFQVLVRDHTGVEESDKKIEVSENMRFGKEIKLSELSSLGHNQRVVCEVKVMRVDEKKTVSGGWNNQNVLVSDYTGTENLTIWGEEIGTMEEERFYILKGVKVDEFNNKKSLSTDRKNCKIEQISCIGMVDDLESENGSECYINVCVAGVKEFDNHSRCVNCESEVPCDVDDPEIGTCGECGTVQRMNEVTAKLIIRSGSIKLTLRASGRLLEDIAEVPRADMTKTSLAKARDFDMEIEDDIIRAVKRM